MRFLLTLIFVHFSNYCFCQTQIFKEYDFSAGGFSILGIFSESDKNGLRDSMGEFYSNDIEILNELKKEWKFNIPGKKYACGYHYTVLLCKDGKILENMAINLNCNEIVTNEGYFYFDTDKLRRFKGRMEKPVRKIDEFDTLYEARNYYNTIIKDKDLIFDPQPIWRKYEGSFRFTFKCEKGTKICLDEDGKIFDSIHEEIIRKYPKEDFEIENVGGSWTTIEIELTCNKSLSHKFDLPNCERNEYFGVFKPFDLRLKTYWKKVKN